MKIITIDCRMVSMSGIGRYISELLPYIISEFKEVVLLGKPEELYKYNTEIVEFREPIYSVKEQIRYGNIIPESKLFWSPHFNVPLFSIKAGKRIVTIHDAFHLAFYQELSIPQKIYAKTLINKALNKSSKIITVSNFSKNELLKYTSDKYKDKIEVIYNGVSDTIQGIESTKNGKPYFLFVGNIKPHKNLKNAIIAFKQFLDKLPKYTEKPFFKIVGKREGFINGSNENLGKILDENPVLKDFVQFTGYVSDQELGDLYKYAKTLVFPSVYEGFGIPPLEAMKFNCPVIASNIESISEICANAVLYFDPYNIKDIAEKMNQIYLSDIKNVLLIKGENKIKNFTWEKSTIKHIEIFKTLL